MFQVNNSISENDQVLTLLIEQYFVSYSENVMHIIISLMTESRAQLLYDAVRFISFFSMFELKFEIKQGIFLVLKNIC